MAGEIVTATARSGVTPGLWVSVLMPVFNAERYVEAAVRSVLVQTFRDFELLIIDDGSSDGSLAILERLAAEDSRIVLRSRPNAGLVSTLNELLAAAHGSLLARMDADDTCRPTRFARQVDHLQRNPACVAVGSRSLFIDPDGMPIFEFMDRFAHDEIDRALLNPEIGILHPSVMMRRSAVVGLGGYRSEFPHVEDLDLFLRLAEIGELCNLPEVLLDYRVHLSSVSHQHGVAQAEAGRRAVAAAARRRCLDPGSIERSAALVSRPESKAELHRKWTWWALSAGNLKTARKHARLALAAEPLNLENVRVLACVTRDSLKRIF